MLLSDIFHHLSSGELSQLSIGGGAQGAVQPENYSRVLSHVNLGLTALYSRFPLKEGRLKMNVVPGRSVYPLHSKHAVSTPYSRESLRFILDTVGDRFGDDVLKVEGVSTDTRYALSLNDASDPYGCTTPSASVLRLPPAMVGDAQDCPDYLKTSTLDVIYRANHPALSVEDYDPDELEIELPASHLQALLYYVASRVNNPIGMTNEFHAGNSYSAKYEKECQMLEISNLEVDQGSQNTRLQSKGWV